MLARAVGRPALYAGGPACGPCQPRRLSLRCPRALRPPRPLRGVPGSSRSAASASRLPGSPLPSGGAAWGPSVPLLRPWVLPRPRRRARPGPRAGPPALVPPEGAPANPAAFSGGGAAAGRSGRAGGGVRGQRPRFPGCAPARFFPCRAVVGLWRRSGEVGFSPISPPAPLPPLGAKGSAKPAILLRQDGRANCTTSAFSQPSPSPLPAERPRGGHSPHGLTIRRLSTARSARQRAPHFPPMQPEEKALDIPRHSCYTDCAKPAAAPAGAAPQGVSVAGTAPSDFVRRGFHFRRPVSPPARLIASTYITPPNETKRLPFCCVHCAQRKITALSSRNERIRAAGPQNSRCGFVRLFARQAFPCLCVLFL